MSGSQTKNPTLIDQVSAILKGDRKARDNDNWLIVRYFGKYFDANFPPELTKTLMRVPFKSIIGTRQVIQNKRRMYPPSRKTLLERGLKEQQIREYMRKFGAS